jgi:hypothetical protein
MMFLFLRKEKKKKKKSFQFYDWINKMVNESNFDNEERMVLYPNYLLSNNIEDPKEIFYFIFETQ